MTDNADRSQGTREGLSLSGASADVLAILAYLRTPDMIEKLAEAIDPEIWSENSPVPTEAGIVTMHKRRKLSCSVAERVIEALVETLPRVVASAPGSSGYSQGSKNERQRIAEWLDEQRKDVPAHGWEFAAAIRADDETAEKRQAAGEPAMDDDEFLSYCNGMADTPRCGFVPEQIARLIRLSGGDEAVAQEWGRCPNQVVSLDRWVVRDAVTKARAFLESNDAPAL